MNDDEVPDPYIDYSIALDSQDLFSDGLAP
jgi:hypothetical protein